MLEGKFYSMPANFQLQFDYLEDDLKLFENSFELPLTTPINVKKQVWFNSYYFITILGGWPAGKMEELKA